VRRLLVGAALLGAMACSPQPDATGCRAVSDVLLEDLQGTLTVKGELRNGYTSRADDLTLVSAELHLTDDPDGKKGDVLTFAAAGESYQAVDRYARKSSSLPDASFDVRRKGVYHSRACAAANRGR
jgi:hypothetical protein